MRKAFLVSGFNSWGKTTLLPDLFGTKAFRKRVPQYFGTCPFLVIPKLNDDLGKKGYEDAFNERLQKFKETNGKAKYIASAFCPTKEPSNDSVDILHTRFKRDQIEMILLEYKWCGHAKLLISEIKSFYASESNVTIHTVASTNSAGKFSQARNIFSSNLP